MADETHITHEVPTSLDGERVDKIVATLGEISRAAARALVDAGEVLGVDGALEAKARLSAGAVVTFPPREERAELVAEPVEFGVVHEDEHVIVVDKPAGVVVHPGAGRTGGTLAAGLIDRYPEIDGVGQPGRWGIVHRLDRDTSGLLVVARTPDAYEALSSAMRRRTVTREYLALVQENFDIPRGTVDAPIGKDPNRPMRRAMVPDGRRAVTHYRMRRQWERPAVALVEVQLETGRTHQIRVHLAGIGHPVVGDRTYGKRDPIEVPRLFLHAARLELDHPATAERLSFVSSLPDDLQDVLGRLE